jgi:cytochrome P450
MTAHLLFDSTTLADPYSVYRTLRENDPVHWAVGEGTWFLTRYDDVQAALHDPRLSARRIMGGLGAGQVADPLNGLLAMTMLFSDPPEHTRMRGLFNRAFTPRAVGGMRPAVQAVVDELVREIEAKQEFDLIEDFAYPLPARVIARVFGVPEDDRARFDRWVHDLAAFIGNPRITVEQRRRALESMREALAYLRQLRARTCEGLLRTLDDDGFSDDELFANVILVITAGHETTQNLIGNGMLALLRHPAEMARLRADPGLIVSAVEELLRYDSPAQWTGRIAREPIELRGQHIRPGQFVIAAQGAANRDPLHFEQPERLDVARRDNRHLAFGFGAHFCIGAGLSRLEGQVAIRTLVQRLPDLRLLEPEREPVWRNNFVLRGLERLPVTLVRERAHVAVR